MGINMPLSDWLRAFAIVFFWGINFVIMKLGLESFSPLMLGGLRFFLVCIPLIFFVPFPKIKLLHFFLYALFMCFLQFALLFSSLAVGLPSGVASVVMQMQVFFTVILAMIFMKEPVRGVSILTIIIALLGLVLIYIGGKGNTSIPILGLVLILLAALSQGIGNLFMKKMPNVNFISLNVWGAIIPIILFFLSSLYFDGWQTIVDSFKNANITSWFAALYLAYVATLVCYVFWGRLLNLYPVGFIAPFILLVPVLGVIAAWALFGEKMSLMQWAGTIVVISALSINLFLPKIIQYLRQKTASI